MIIILYGVLPSAFSTFSRLSLMSTYHFNNEENKEQSIWMRGMWREARMRTGDVLSDLGQRPALPCPGPWALGQGV